jgi:hypothetical protein
MKVGDRCEIRIVWRGKSAWFGGRVVAIATNGRSIKVAWMDPDGGERETEAPIQHVREVEAEPARKPRRFKGGKVASTPSTTGDGEAIAIEVKVKLMERPEPVDPVAAVEAAGSGGQGGASGWIETYFVSRSGREYGPYRRRCWREGGKKRSQYLGGGF